VGSANPSKHAPLRKKPENTTLTRTHVPAAAQFAQMKRLDGTLDRRLKANRAGYGRGAGAAAGASAEAGGGRGQTVREGDGGGGGGRLPTPVLYPSLPWQTSDATRTPSTPTPPSADSQQGTLYNIRIPSIR